MKKGIDEDKLKGLYQTIEKDFRKEKKDENDEKLSDEGEDDTSISEEPEEDEPVDEEKPHVKKVEDDDFEVGFKPNVSASL